MNNFNATKCPVKRKLLSSALNRTLFAASLMAGLSSSGWAVVAPGELIISEVMANPAAVSDGNGEWFEIFNTTSMSLDINGLQLQDTGSNNHIIVNDGPLWVAPGEYFVLGRNNDMGSNGGYSADYVYSDFTLGNSSDDILLLWESVTVASLSYNSLPFGVGGVSAEWTGAGYQATPDTFQYGAGDIGTPGGPGSIPIASEVPVPAAGWMLLSAISSLIVGKKRQRSRRSLRVAD